MGGFLSVVISAMAVWMDLREEAVDNSWVLFSIMAGFLLQLLEKGPKGMIIFLTGAAVPLIRENGKNIKETRRKTGNDKRGRRGIRRNHGSYVRLGEGSGHTGKP